MWVTAVKALDLAAILLAQRQTALQVRLPSAFSEVRRIVGLPTIAPLAPEEVEALNRQEVLAGAYAAGFRQRPNQLEALLAWDRFRGCFGQIAVGFGKTLTTISIAERVYRAGMRKSLLLVPPSVFSQFWDDLREARTRIPFSVDFMALDASRTRHDRAAFARQNRPGCYVMPYSLLRTEDTSELLEIVKPEEITLDEADELANRSAAQTKRLFRYVREHRPYGVAVSGTTTSKSIIDYWHIISWCLGRFSPLPLDRQVAEVWSGIVDAEAAPSIKQALPIQPLVEWARREFPREAFSLDVTGYRKAYRIRLATAPGVVTTGAAGIPTKLRIENRPVAAPETRPGWDDLAKLVEAVDVDYLTPNGDRLEHAMLKYKWLHELSAGFYYELTWPSPEEYAHRKHISTATARDILARAQAHHAARQDYAAELRPWLEHHHRVGLDTPRLVGLSIARDGARHVPEVLVRLWGVAKALDFEGRPDRDSAAVRVCDYKVDHAIQWAEGHRDQAIVWYYHDELGLWLVEQLAAAGFRPLHCPAGREPSKTIRQTTSAQRLVVASIRGHGRGKNLQHFKHQLVVQMPRSAKHLEQLLGRVHRQGQDRDTIIVDTCLTTAFDRQYLSAALNDALYIHQTTGSYQKAVTAVFDPKPTIYPTEWLRENGFRTKLLNEDQKTLLTQTFGGS